MTWSAWFDAVTSQLRSTCTGPWVSSQVFLMMGL